VPRLSTSPLRVSDPCTPTPKPKSRPDPRAAFPGPEDFFHFDQRLPPRGLHFLSRISGHPKLLSTLHQSDACSESSPSPPSMPEQPRPKLFFRSVDFEKNSDKFIELPSCGAVMWRYLLVAPFPSRLGDQIFTPPTSPNLIRRTYNDRSSFPIRFQSHSR